MTDSLADRLTVFNWKTLEVDPHFAESWEQVAGDKWRFTIKEGISYHSGNIVTAEDYAWNLNWQVDPDNGARFNRYGVGMSAAAIDETTFEVSCENNCPVAPKLITHLHAGDPAGQSDRTGSSGRTTANGPYKLVDWSPGVSVTYEYFEDYWGPKPQITEVTWLWRGEASVRAAMIAVGEAHWAWDIENTNVDQVPKFISTESVETSAFHRRHPLERKHQQPAVPAGSSPGDRLRDDRQQYPGRPGHLPSRFLPSCHDRPSR